METKVKILGDCSQEKRGKPIKLIKCLQTEDASFLDCDGKNFLYKEIIKLSTYEYNGYDLFLCVPKENSNNGQIWLGHFNDGVV